MVIEEFLAISSSGMQTALFVSAPVLLFGLVAGVLVSIFQAATQINDASLAFLPKIMAVIVALAIFGSWMLSKMASFAVQVFNQIPNITS
jgi:flagellar biosynthetic protein FliQ